MTETQRKAMQHALEAIDWLRHHLTEHHACLHMSPQSSGIPAWVGKTEAALRAALAEPEPEPEPVAVAWVRLDAWESGKEWPNDCFSALPADGLTPLYTTPPTRRPLTNAEIDQIADSVNPATPLQIGKRLFARAVERKITGGNDE